MTMTGGCFRNHWMSFSLLPFGRLASGTAITMPPLCLTDDVVFWAVIFHLQIFFCFIILVQVNLGLNNFYIKKHNTFGKIQTFCSHPLRFLVPIGILFSTKFKLLQLRKALPCRVEFIKSYSADILDFARGLKCQKADSIFFSKGAGRRSHFNFNIGISASHSV